MIDDVNVMKFVPCYCLKCHARGFAQGKLADIVLIWRGFIRFEVDKTSRISKPDAAVVLRKLTSWQATGEIGRTT